MLADRRSLFYSTYEATSFADAMDFEYSQGLPIVEAEAIKGAKKFAGSEKVGRGASFDLDGVKGRGTELDISERLEKGRRD